MLGTMTQGRVFACKAMPNNPCGTKTWKPSIRRWAGAVARMQDARDADTTDQGDDADVQDADTTDQDADTTDQGDDADVQDADSRDARDP